MHLYTYGTYVLGGQVMLTVCRERERHSHSFDSLPFGHLVLIAICTVVYDMCHPHCLNVGGPHKFEQLADCQLSFWSNIVQLLLTCLCRGRGERSFGALRIVRHQRWSGVARKDAEKLEDI